MEFDPARCATVLDTTTISSIKAQTKPDGTLVVIVGDMAIKIAKVIVAVV